MKLKTFLTNLVCLAIVSGATLFSLQSLNADNSIAVVEAHVVVQSTFPVVQVTKPIISTLPREYLFYRGELMPTPAEELECLATNVYFEARNQSTVGQLAVSHVIMNRAADKRFPNTICGVTYQSRYTKTGHPIRNKCHFSWFCDGEKDVIDDALAYTKIYNLMLTSFGLYYAGTDLSDGSTHYHTISSNPRWAAQKKFIMTIDAHHFYRWK